MTGAEVADFLGAYQQSFSAPVLENTEVRRVGRVGEEYVVSTSNGDLRCRAVVIATGACGTPKIPSLADALPGHINQLAPIHYRNPEQIGSGRVLVVGASASGAQIADELQRSGRDVTLAVGDHVRLPRTYRGMDIHWWMDALGLLDEKHTEMEDLNRARRLPSLQLIGSPSKRTLDLNSLSATGVELVGRFAGVAGSKAQFSGSFANQCASADLKLGRLLLAIDQYATDKGLDAEVQRPDRPQPTSVPAAATEVGLADFSTVIWATGFRPNYPWLNQDLLDHKGAIRHDGGVMEQPGMYVLGLPFTRRRKSTFLDGVGPDALELADHLHTHLNTLART